MQNLTGKQILAIDYGLKFSGLATFKVGSDPFPLCWGRLQYKDDEKLVKDLVTIIEDEFVDIVVLGIPYFTDGSQSKMTQKVLEFLIKLENILTIPVYKQDESLTTYEAEQRMKNDPRFNFNVDPKMIDAVSATIILEEFISSEGTD